uniref:Leishmanolysin-like peptidase n=1 Tax=Cryptobia salmositica TaxID=86678 RepID=Q68QF6_9EUGL|nr:metalloproteinase [Cryptobia salmositica]
MTRRRCKEWCTAQLWMRKLGSDTPSHHRGSLSAPLRNSTDPCRPPMRRRRSTAPSMRRLWGIYGSRSGLLILIDSSRYCTTVGSAVSDFQSPKQGPLCTVEDILTDYKRDVLLNVLLPSATKMLLDALRVNRVAGNLKTTGCRRYTVPPAHSTTGVPDADFVIYLSAVPANGLAGFGGLCQMDIVGRPVAGMINIAPRVIHIGMEIQKVIRLIVHEILHALGFSSPFLSIGKKNRRGYKVNYIKSESVVARAREHLNCSTLKGPETENKDRTSHWKQRNHMDDIMSPRVNKWMYLSAVTLAVMEDTGHYAIDWSRAETPKWMYKAGCGVINDRCDAVAGGLKKYFCNDENLYSCSADHDGYGKCGITTYQNYLPQWSQYFTGDPRKGGLEEWMDYCPIVSRKYGYCKEGEKCFKTDGMEKEGEENSYVSCLKTRCVSGNVEFQLPNKSDWIRCPTEDYEASIEGNGNCDVP